jgi:hypothetical protein
MNRQLLLFRLRGRAASSGASRGESGRRPEPESALGAWASSEAPHSRFRRSRLEVLGSQECSANELRRPVGCFRGG